MSTVPAQRKRRRWWLLAATALVVVLLAAIAAVAWHYSNDVVVPDHSGAPFEIEVLALDPSGASGDASSGASGDASPGAVPGPSSGRPGTIELARTDETDKPGIYGLDWPDGWAIVGQITDETPETITRQLHAVEGELAPGELVRIDAYVYNGDPLSARGLDYREVEINGELGSMPAWEIGPRRNRRWAIVVHGINSSRRLALPIAPTLSEAGLTTLAISYRDDIGAPSSPDGHHHMGLTEWRDLEAAAEYALERGARELLLIGHSMGGSLVAQFLLQSDLAGNVKAAVLDAPALDWPATISFGARQMGLPEFAAKPVQWMIGLRIDADWQQLDVLAQANELRRVPILLFHGDADNLVPIEPSEAFAAALPDSVTFYRVPEARHVRSWNVDPALYEKRLRRFIESELPAAAG